MRFIFLQTRSALRTFICLFAGLLALAGCAALQPDFETPVVTISSFRAVPSTGAVPAFEIGLRVVNPNRQALALQGITYTVSLEGRELVSGAGKDLPTIEGYSEGTFTVTAAANLFEGFRLLNDLMNAPKDTVNYEVSTKLDIGRWSPAIRVRDSGEITLAPQRDR